MHSGFAPLASLMEAEFPGSFERISGEQEPPRGAAARLAGKIRNFVRPPVFEHPDMPFIERNSPRLETRIARAVAAREPDVVVLQALEEQYYLLAAERPKWRRTRLLAVSHQPPAWWRLCHPFPETVKALDAVIVLSTEALEFWKGMIDPARLHFVPHGVDLDFFTPAPSVPAPASGAPLRVLFSGLWLRDFETLSEVVCGAQAEGLNVRFDLVIPYLARYQEEAACYRMARSPIARWHAGMDDETLRELYRNADIALQPLKDSTANNGLLESMACGLPIVVTDVGGVRDYVTEAFTDFVPLRDPAAILALLRRYSRERDGLRDRGKAARRHAEKHFGWREIARRYAQLVNDLRGAV